MNTYPSLRNLAVAALAGLAFLPATSRADNYFDNGGGDNLWSNNTNWNPDGAPSGTITIAGGLSATSNADVTLGAGTVLIGYDPNAYAIGSGPGGNGILNVTAGNFTFSGGTFGLALGPSAPQGTLNVNGSGTVNIAAGNLLVGWDPAGGTRGTGTVNVGTGGTLNITTTGLQRFGHGADGYLNITGGTVNQSSGTLEITAGGGLNAGFSMTAGTLNVNQEMRIGNAFAITTGSQSGGTINKLATQVGNFAIGVNSAPISYSHTGGTLNVEDTAGSMIVGWNSGDVEIFGGQSYTLNGGTINIGQTSQAGLRLALGAFKTTMNVQSGSLNIGASSAYGLRIGESFATGGNGIMNVSGGTVTVNGGNMWVGFGASSTGVVTQTGGIVTVVSGQNLQVGFDPSSTGTYNLNGGTLEVSSIGIAGTGSAFNFGSGTLKNNANMTTSAAMNLTGAAIWDTNGFNAEQNAAISGAGSLTKVGTGTLKIGSGGSFSGGLTVNDGTFEIATGGSVATPGDVNIASTGTLKLAGGSIAVNSGANHILNQGTYDVNGQTVAAGSYETSAFWAANAKLVNSSATAATIVGTGNKNTVWINATGAGIETVGDLNIGSIVTDGAGTYGFTKTGAGTLTLSNVGNDLSGTTTVSAGTLILSGGLAGGGTVNVGTNGAIGGGGDLTGSLHLDAGADFVFSLTNTLTVNGGTVSFGGLSIANIVGLDSSVALGIYTLIDGSATFDFTNVSNLNAINQTTIGGGKFAYFESGSLNVVVVPEPATWMLLAIGLSTVAVLRRRRTA